MYGNLGVLFRAQDFIYLAVAPGVGGCFTPQPAVEEMVGGFGLPTRTLQFRAFMIETGVVQGEITMARPGC